MGGFALFFSKVRANRENFVSSFSKARSGYLWAIWKQTMASMHLGSIAKIEPLFFALFDLVGQTASITGHKIPFAEHDRAAKDILSYTMGSDVEDWHSRRPSPFLLVTASCPRPTCSHQLFTFLYEATAQ
jgi:hypothetical protein